jgi:hypothetical protein
MTLHQILEVTEQLSYHQRELLLQVLSQRQREARRSRIATRAKKARLAFQLGQLTTERAEELITRLHASVAKTP